MRRTNRRVKSVSGFTLIELMVVVTIIGILASISMPAYHEYIVRSQVADGITLVESLKGPVKEFYKQRGRFPFDNLEAGIPEPDKLMSNYVKRVTLENGAFHVEFGHKVNLKLLDKILTIRPVVVSESPMSPYSWLCGNDTSVPGMEGVGTNQTSVDDSLLPSSCRAWSGAFPVSAAAEQATSETQDGTGLGDALGEP